MFSPRTLLGRSSQVWSPRTHPKDFQLEAFRQMIDTEFDEDDCDERFDVNDDMVQKRFMVANGSVPEKAVEQLKAAIKWRKEVEIWELLPDEFKSEAVKGTATWYKFDKFGRPVLYVRPRFHITAKRDLDKSVKMISWIMEHALDRSPHAQQIVVIYDTRDVGWKNFDNPLTKQGANILQTCYPERLAHLFVINEPFVVSAIWKLIKVFLDPRVKEKIQFCGKKDPADILLKYIPEENVPEEYGGSSVDPYVFDMQVLMDTYYEALKDKTSEASDDDRSARSDASDDSRGHRRDRKERHANGGKGKGKGVNHEMVSVSVDSDGEAERNHRDLDLDLEGVKSPSQQKKEAEWRRHSSVHNQYHPDGIEETDLTSPRWQKPSGKNGKKKGFCKCC
eukprot:GFYU01002934.1.p1 GENE.GFYU01002934.1~~GFYU01002934.1.p1  ORF type:complete len:393 (-),score=119.49 GFYU01002934.1:229-1407(-)